MRTKILVGIVLALVLVFLVACGGYEGPEVGVVVEKEYDDPDSGTHPGYTTPATYTPGSTTCSGIHPNRFCTTSPGHWVPGHYVPPRDWYDPAHYYLVIEETTPEEGKKPKRGRKSVREHVYNAGDVGDCYNTKTEKWHAKELESCD